MALTMRDGYNYAQREAIKAMMAEQLERANSMGAIDPRTIWTSGTATSTTAAAMFPPITPMVAYGSGLSHATLGPEPEEEKSFIRVVSPNALLNRINSLLLQIKTIS